LSPPYSWVSSYTLPTFTILLLFTITFAYDLPSDGKLNCLSSSESEYRQFLSAAADEDVYLGIGNPFAY
jgi:hypothetical protein